MEHAIHPVRVNHLNAVIRDFDATAAHMRDLFGGELFLDLPGEAFHACLIATGQVIFEFFAPGDFLITARQGAHFLGIEYQADLTEVRAALAERGIGIVRDIGQALHTDPADCFGVAFEFWDGSFHDKDWPLIGGRIKSAEYWEEEHPLGLTGLLAYTLAVIDADAACAFLEDLLSAELAYDEARPAIAARAVGLIAGDAIIELLAPTGDGAVRDYLLRNGEGIRSAVFGVRDLAQARRYFAERDVPLVAGSSVDSFGIDPKANQGLLFEFRETAD